MALDVWRPSVGLRRPSFRELSRLEREMENMVGQFFRDWPVRGDGEAREWLPAVDMLQRKDEIAVVADLPGLQRKDIEVSVEDGMLTIRGERREEHQAREEEYYSCERWAGRFARHLMLPSSVDTARIKATFHDGLLEIHLPRTKEATGRRIDIQAA